MSYDSKEVRSCFGLELLPLDSQSKKIISKLWLCVFSQQYTAQSRF